MRRTVKHVPSSLVRDAHERVVGCGLVIVPVSSPLRHTVEKMAGDDVRLPGTNRGGGRLDHWRPTPDYRFPRGCKLKRRRVGEENLAGWKDQEVTEI